MAKTKHNNFLDTVDEIFTDAKNQGVFHLYTEDEAYSGRQLQINGKQMYHFGTTGYLGLEQDPRLKQAAIDAIIKYGTQFPLSKTFVSFVLYKELEEKLYEMYQNPVLVAKNSTLCHLSVIPSVVRDEDLVILDHQVHNSVQSACQMLKPRGIKVEMIRHNNLNMLEDRIKTQRDKYSKIWYMVDGVYSMFGDVAPLPELLQLLDKYPQLHLYVDDVHGMSWAGKHGTGYVMNTIKELHEKMVLVGTLSKSFGASGGIMVCKNKELSRYVKTFGGPLSFSAQLEPPCVGAAVASAKIHLSDEIYQMQNEVAGKIAYCNELIKKAGIPLMEENQCPVFYVPTGLPSSGYNMSKRLMDDGFYVNMGIFPAVPVKNTGIRFTVSRHNQFKEIEQLVEAIKYHYPRMLEEEGRTENEVRSAFKLAPIAEEIKKETNENSFTVIHKRSIDEIDISEWNSMFGGRGVFDWNGIKTIEKSFINNEAPEENWDFHYIIIKDGNGKTIAATFFTVGLYKDDMMAPYSISKQIEEERIRNPYYLTSKVVSMGSLVTEGEHLYLNKDGCDWRAALKMMFNIISHEQEKSNASMIMLRDFEDADSELKEFLTGQGYIKVALPETCIVENLNWNDTDGFLGTIGARSRRHIRNEVLKFESFFDVNVEESPTPEKLKEYIKLFRNVKSKNLDINTFDYPEKFFENMALTKNWEFIELKLNQSANEYNETGLAAVIFCYKNSNNDYNPIFVGLDYSTVEKYNTYRQAIFQVVKRASSIHANRIFLGLSATVEKKKFGARAIPKFAYVQAKDNFNMEFIETMAVKNH
jgi:7-keto-8-aminopelargonate synthetase-like enzyme